MSLPRIFNITLENIPAAKGYLKAASNPSSASGFSISWGDQQFNDAKCNLGLEILKKDPRLKIGLIWAGGKQHKNDHNRSLNLASLKPLLELPNMGFYSLQYGVDSRDIAALGFSEKLIDLTPYIADFADTALLMEELDLIISVDTAPAHLAGALGRATWLLLPYSPDFRWLLDRANSPWYQNMRLFRQPRPGDWDPVIQQVKCELEKQEK